ncbi:recombinase family protein [Nonomuraea sp. LP-02]|uniref:recombinase family protein n=1 Tax=Nonomuraea sp. LP-02 TaxID=3097960 RepID=UPI002E3806F4|nr:recombinase family protein [Nonomuraea sp. LP-02]MED7928172.1 recombinase family protein [Nonomuraea sp. LP-02]
MRRAAIYCRISQDRAGAGLGVARQEADCRALIERRGWHVTDVYCDNDVSAYSGSPRPAWQRLLDDIGAGTIDAIVCWHVDRLTRSPRELEDVIDLADRRGIELAIATGEIDLATPTGRLIAPMLGAAARHEAEHKAERQKRQRRQNAEAGKVSGGGMRPYGYAENRIPVIEEEAEIIREAARRVLAGESLASVCKDFEQRDVKTPTGRHWIPTTLRRLLAAARISGRREHTPRSSYGTTRPLVGEIVADTVWPAIISPADSDRLRALLSDPARNYRRQAATGRTYLLSGILRCGRCGHRMNGRPRQCVPRYVCPNVPGSGSCGGVATNAIRTATTYGTCSSPPSTLPPSPNASARTPETTTTSPTPYEPTKNSSKNSPKPGPPARSAARNGWPHVHPSIYGWRETVPSSPACPEPRRSSPSSARPSQLGDHERLSATCDRLCRHPHHHRRTGQPSQEVGSGSLHFRVDRLSSLARAF